MPVQRSTGRHWTTTHETYKGRACTAMLCPCASICRHGLLADLDQSWDQHGTEALKQAGRPLWCLYVCQAPSGHKSRTYSLESFRSLHVISGLHTHFLYLTKKKKKKSSLVDVPISHLYTSLYQLDWTEKNLFTPRPAGSKHRTGSKRIILLIAGLPAKAQPLLATGVAGKSLVWHLNTALSTR